MPPGRLKYLIPIKFKDTVLKHVKGKEAEYCSVQLLVPGQHRTGNVLCFISSLSAHLAGAGVLRPPVCAGDPGSGRGVYRLRGQGESQEKTARATGKDGVRNHPLHE